MTLDIKKVKKREVKPTLTLKKDPKTVQSIKKPENIFRYNSKKLVSLIIKYIFRFIFNFLATTEIAKSKY